MTRSLTGLCFGLTLLHPVHGATFYGATPYPLIAPTSTATFQPAGLIPTRPGTDGHSIVISPDGKTAYFPACGSPFAYCPIIGTDLATGTTVHTYQTLYLPRGPMAILPNGSQLYVATCDLDLKGQCTFNASVEVFDIASEKKVATISIGEPIAGLTVAPNGSAVYCVHVDAIHPTTKNGVTAIDVASLKAGATFYPPIGMVPQSVAVSAHSNTGYVLAPLGPTAIYVIDLRQMALKSTIALPGSGGASLAVSDNGATLAVTVAGSGELVLIDTTTETIAQTIQGFGDGQIIGMSPDGNTVYFLDFSLGLETVDTNTGTITTQLAGEPVSSASLSTDGKTIYLFLDTCCAGASAPNAHNSGGILAVQDGAPASRIFELGQPSSWLAVSPYGETLYSANPNGISAVSTATGAVISTMLPGVDVNAVAVSPDGGTLYALSAGSYSFTIVNASTGAVENTIAVPTCTTGDNLTGSMALTPAGGWAFVIVNPCGSVVPIDLKTQTAEPPISGTSGSALAVSPLGTILYASAGRSVVVIDLVTRRLVGTIPIAANSIVFSPWGTRAYIAGTWKNMAGVAVIDTFTRAVSNFIPVSDAGGGSESIAITRDGNYVYVGATAGNGWPVVAVIDTQKSEIVGDLLSGPPFVVH